VCGVRVSGHVARCLLGYLLNHIVLMCSRKEDEAALVGTEPLLTAKVGALMADEPTFDIAVGC